jgi:hypothetical protein
MRLTGSIIGARGPLSQTQIPLAAPQHGAGDRCLRATSVRATRAALSPRIRGAFVALFLRADGAVVALF